MKAILNFSSFCIATVILLSGCVPATSTLWNEYRSYPLHKAYAIGENKIAGAAWGQKTSKEAINLALNYCKTSGGINCNVIDVDNTSPEWMNKTKITPENKNKNNNQTGMELTGAATGFFVNPDTIVTAEHVISSCDVLTVNYNGVSYDARIMTTDTLNDIAILKTENHTNGTAKLRNKSKAKKGEQITVYGFPFVGLLSDEAKITDGIINSTSGLLNDIRYLQISAPIQPGNSGGPLLDKNGAVAGIVLSSLSPAYTSFLQGKITIPQNVNFAIKSSMLIDILEQANIPFDIQESNKELSTIEIAEDSEKYTARILCWEK